MRKPITAAVLLTLAAVALGGCYYPGYYGYGYPGYYGPGYVAAPPIVVGGGYGWGWHRGWGGGWR